MRGREKYTKKRAEFCKLAMTDTKQAAEKLRVMAKGLDNCKNTGDIIFALEEIFLVSERTIFNDLKK